MDVEPRACDVALQRELFAAVERYEDLKARGGSLDFLDLLLRARDLIRTDREVREYGQMMVREHHDMRVEGKAVSDSAAIAPEVPANDPGEANLTAAMSSLEQAAKGEAFDRAYIAQAVTMHEEALGTARNALQSTRNPRVRALVEKAIPVIQRVLGDPSVSDLVDRVGMMMGGHAAQAATWTGMVEEVVRRFGDTGPTLSCRHSTTLPFASAARNCCSVVPGFSPAQMRAPGSTASSPFATAS